MATTEETKTVKKKSPFPKLIISFLVIIIVALIALIIGGVAVYIYTQNDEPTGGEGTENPACIYNDEEYAEGESFPSDDGCNTCFCNNGSVGCTEIACLDDDSEDEDVQDTSETEAFPNPMTVSFGGGDVTLPEGWYVSNINVPKTMLGTEDEDAIVAQFEAMSGQNDLYWPGGAVFLRKNYNVWFTNGDSIAILSNDLEPIWGGIGFGPATYEDMHGTVYEVILEPQVTFDNSNLNRETMLGAARYIGADGKTWNYNTIYKADHYDGVSGEVYYSLGLEFAIGGMEFEGRESDLPDADDLFIELCVKDKSGECHTGK